MKSLPFQSTSHLGSAVAYTLRTADVERHLQVFRWEDRLVAYEPASGMWWCTLDAYEKRDVREFWHECVKNERVGRFYSQTRDFRRTSASKATIAMGVYQLYVVVAQDNSGMARIHDETTWHAFPAGEVWGIHKPLAARPTIWSQRFQGKFGLHAVEAVGASLEEEVLMKAPEQIRTIWEQGTSALPIRLIMAAFSLGWAEKLEGRKTPYKFWRVVLQERFKGPQSLPKGLLRCPEVELPGYIDLPMSAYYVQTMNYRSFVWREPKLLMHLRFRVRSESAHELMEYRLELRAWLSQFFTPEEVEMLFSDVRGVK